jgi:hypothetical protein
MNDGNDGMAISQLGESLEQLIWEVNITLQTPDLKDNEAVAPHLRALRSKLWSTLQLVDLHLPTAHASRIVFTPATGNMVELSEQGG